MSPTLELQQVSVYYGNQAAIEQASLTVQAGELMALVGPSGCGKSSLLASINRMTDSLPGCRVSGTIMLGGEALSASQDATALRRRIGMVFQQPNPFPLSIIDNLRFPLAEHGVPRRERDPRAEQALRAVGLWEEVKDRLLQSALGLSGGQQQRLCIARALVLEPQVLLFDEPLSNLDAKLRRQVREDIRAIQQDLGLTVVYVTHDQEEALAVSDEIVVMRNAAIAQIGTPRQLFEAPNDRFVADFIGEANLLACTIVAIDGQTATIDIEGYRHDLPSRGLSEGPATIAVRPSRLRIGDDRGIRATVAKATYVGVRMEYTLTGAFGQVFAVHEDVDAPLAPGAEVRMGFAAKGPVLLHE